MRTTHLLTVSHSSPGVGCLPEVVCPGGGGLCVHPGGCVSGGRVFGVCVLGCVACWPCDLYKACWDTQPPCGQTDTCKNITFLPQALLWAVKCHFVFQIFLTNWFDEIWKHVIGNIWERHHHAVLSNGGNYLVPKRYLSPLAARLLWEYLTAWNKLWTPWNLLKL